MAENSVIISSEEEAKLLKPIDEYVEEIQKKIDALRADGFDKVNDLKKQIAIAKENKNLSATQRDKIIENSKKELENAKKVEADNKEEIKKLIAEAEDYLAKHYKKDYYDVVNNSCKAAKAEENNRYEIRDVIGPDEYKEHVDNNAYTNYMAHENMRLAAQVIACIRDEKKDIYGKMQKLMQEEGTSLEQLEEELKDKMKKLYLPQPDEKTGIIPQFDGYFDLKEIDLSVYKNASVVGTVFHDYSGEDVQGMQAGKQADIVELLYQMEDITTPDNKAKNYVYYEARTLHDSSLSKAIHSITACDLGMEKEAYEMFMSAALTDLGQEMKSSDAGIHSANMGGVWQDVVMGFGGVRIHDGHLRIRPNCPKQWEKFTYPIYWKGNKLDVTVCKDGVEVINEGTAFMAEIMGQMVTVEKGKNEFLA